MIASMAGNRMTRSQMAPYLAEALGTFALVFGGPGAAAVNHASNGSVETVGVGLCFGLIVMAVIFALGNVSGAHINPAVSLSFRLIGRITSRRLAGYVLAQLAGATLAGLAILAILGDDVDGAVTTPTINGAGAALASEAILTFFLVLVILAGATDDRAKGAFAAIAVGGYVGMAATGWGPVAGASMNPARSFGPAVAANVWESHWVYWVGPLVASAIAVVVYELLREPRTPGVAQGIADNIEVTE